MKSYLGCYKHMRVFWSEQIKNSIAVISLIYCFPTLSFCNKNSLWDTTPGGRDKKQGEDKKQGDMYKIRRALNEVGGMVCRLLEYTHSFRDLETEEAAGTWEWSCELSIPGEEVEWAVAVGRKGCSWLERRWPQCRGLRAPQEEPELSQGQEVQGRVLKGLCDLTDTKKITGALSRKQTEEGESRSQLEITAEVLSESHRAVPHGQGNRTKMDSKHNL